MKSYVLVIKVLEVKVNLFSQWILEKFYLNVDNGDWWIKAFT